MAVLWTACWAVWGASDARAFCRLTTEAPLPHEPCTQAGEPLAWPRQCLSYSITAREADAALDFEQVRDIVDTSFGAWGSVQCEGRQVGLSLRQTVELSRCQEPEHAPGAGNSNSVIFVQDWREQELPEEAFGLTVIWHDPKSGEIFDADMQLNESMGEYQACESSCPRGVVDLQNVVTHEAGHFLGLGHSPVPTASMHDEARLGETRKRYLGSDDRAGLCAIYGELPEVACEGGDYAPHGGLQLMCHAPAESSCRAAPSAGAAPWLTLLLSLGLLGVLRLRWYGQGDEARCGAWRRWRDRRRVGERSVRGIARPRDRAERR